MPESSDLYAHVLSDWQRQAVDAWRAGDGVAPYRGTLEVFTGGGKTLMALAAWQYVAEHEGAANLVVVVPTEALANQWKNSLSRWLDVSTQQIGLLGAGGNAQVGDYSYLVAVINSAAVHLPRTTDGPRTMLVVDECHRAGAPTFSRVLDTAARFRLGLSATPERQEVDEHGLPVEFDEQVVGRKLGGIVFRFSLRDAREAGWLPDYELHHHGVVLSGEEKREYDAISRKVTELQDQLRDRGLAPVGMRRRLSDDEETAAIQRAYVAATATRKGLLYSSSERRRVAVNLVVRAHEGNAARKVLLFHERVQETEAIADALGSRFGEQVALEHSGLAPATRTSAMERFRSGAAPILVSVKTLVEGVDVPDAEVGISVAASSSVRQRVQSLGRVLRRSFDGDEKRAEMHVIYVRDTVDEQIYEEEDWEDLTGPNANTYWHWGLGDQTAHQVPGPPRKPHPTEEQIYADFGPDPLPLPRPWPGLVPEHEFSVDSRGTVTTEQGAVVENPQNVAEMVQAVRGTPGGRFYVTSGHRYVIVTRRTDDPDSRVMLAGRLAEPFRVRSGDPKAELADRSELAPGAVLEAMPNKELGTFKIRQKSGGMIEHREGRTSWFALDEDEEDPKQRAAKQVLRAWKSLSLPGIDVFVDSSGTVWYLDAGAPKFLGRAPEGFRFPSDEED